MSGLKDGGYAQQVENFELLIRLVKQVGSAYNPANEMLSLANLENLHLQAKNALEEWVNAHLEFERISSQRKDELNSLFLFVTCLSREVKVCGIRGEILYDIMSIIRQFRGQRASAQIVVLKQSAINLLCAICWALPITASLLKPVLEMYIMVLKHLCKP
jgi:hypothetical protein